MAELAHQHLARLQREAESRAESIATMTLATAKSKPSTQRRSVMHVLPSAPACAPAPAPTTAPEPQAASALAPPVLQEAPASPPGPAPQETASASAPADHEVKRSEDEDSSSKRRRLASEVQAPAQGEHRSGPEEEGPAQSTAGLGPLVEVTIGGPFCRASSVGKPGAAAPWKDFARMLSPGRIVRLEPQHGGMCVVFWRENRKRWTHLSAKFIHDHTGVSVGLRGHYRVCRITEQATEEKVGVALQACSEADLVAPVSAAAFAAVHAEAPPASEASAARGATPVAASSSRVRRAGPKTKLGPPCTKSCIRIIALHDGGHHFSFAIEGRNQVLGYRLSVLGSQLSARDD